MGAFFGAKAPKNRAFRGSAIAPFPSGTLRAPTIPCAAPYTDENRHEFGIAAGPVFNKASFECKLGITALVKGYYLMTQSKKEFSPWIFHSIFR
jgi:hypothetical protein